MLVLTVIALSSIFFVGAVFFVECKIVEDLPDNNSFKKWWRKHIIGLDPEG